MKLRTGLFLLVAGTLIPVLFLALLLGAMLIGHERDTFEALARDRNRAVISAVDAALDGHISTLKALSVSSNLASGHFRAFEGRLERILRSQPDWQDVILSGPDGRHLVDAANPGGESEVTTADMESVREVVRTRAPAIGSVVQRGSKREYGIAVRFPILQPGTQEVAYVLSAIIRTAPFQRLLESQALPEGWVSGLVDANLRFIARVPARAAGAMASDDFRAHIGAAPEGWYRGRTVEGTDSFTAFLRSPRTRWAIGLGVPAEVVTASSRHANWTLALGTIVALLLAAGIAWFTGRRIAEPIASLALAARRLGRNEQADGAPLRTSLDELHDVGRALTEATSAIGERGLLREREQAALRDADRAKDEFIAVLGHELRNPLSAIANSARLLREAPHGSRADAMAREIIERQTRQMTRLVEDLLDMSRLATGKMVLHRERFDLADAARSLVDTWLGAQRVAEGRVHVLASPAPIHADRARIEQVIANLLDNATKFTPPDRPVEVRVRAEGREAVLEVEDDGEGMTPDLLRGVFRPFVQGPQENHRPAGGLGLGLSVVEKLVALHGGTVSASSDGPGKGSTFTVRLPLSVPAG